MFINVRCLNGYHQLFTYKVPDDWSTDDLLGAFVRVPLRYRTELAIVCEIMSEFDNPQGFTIKTAYTREPFPQDTYYMSYIKQLAQYYALDHMHFLKRVRAFLTEKQLTDIIISQQSDAPQLSHAVTLTPEQQAIVTTIQPVLQNSSYYPALLHGVTGSGKTEVYKQLIIHTLELNKTALFLVPEVSLAVQFTQIFKKQLPSETQIFGFHSATSVSEKRALWAALVSGAACVIVGVHLPILMPIANVGLILLDEEHDINYQEKRFPHVHTKEAALMRAYTYKIPILLGSATPSISTLYTARTKNWQCFELKKRFAGAFPQVKLVKMLDNKNQRSVFWISNELLDALKDRLAKQEQAILFLNRRGYSFFMQCKNCGFIPTCASCSVSLTLHSNNLQSNNILVCHYCNFKQQALSSCTACASKQLLKKGLGTQQLVSILQDLLPQARIARADLDTSVNKKHWQQTLAQFESGALDILVGTQTITKGYHFPRVTLVGVIWADINLSMPFYNAAEITLQQLIQVAGRAGRASDTSLVIVQTILDHPLYNYTNEINYPDFYTYELDKRQLVSYPPIIRLAQLEVRSACEHSIDQEADKLFDWLYTRIQDNNYQVKLLGPTQPPVHKIKNISIRKIYLKSDSFRHIHALYQSIDHTQFSCAILFTPNPLS